MTKFLRYRLGSSGRVTYLDFSSVDEAKAFIESHPFEKENLCLWDKLTQETILTLKVN